MFTYNGQTYAAYPMGVKLRNVVEAKAIVEEIKAIADGESNGMQLSAWRTVLQKFPELSMYITTTGSYNQATISERVRQNHEAYARDHADKPDAPVFDDAAAEEEARQWCAQRVQQMLISSPDMMRIVTFSTGAYPTTIGALEKGVDIVRRIVDRAKTPEQTIALIDQPLEHDFWQDIDAGEVAAFIDQFRAQFK